MLIIVVSDGFGREEAVTELNHIDDFVHEQGVDCDCDLDNCDCGCFGDRIISLYECTKDQWEEFNALSSRGHASHWFNENCQERTLGDCIDLTQTLPSEDLP
jgi:hypothetical protein